MVVWVALKWFLVLGSFTGSGASLPLQNPPPLFPAENEAFAGVTNFGLTPGREGV